MKYTYAKQKEPSTSFPSDRFKRALSYGPLVLAFPTIDGASFKRGKERPAWDLMALGVFRYGSVRRAIRPTYCVEYRLFIGQLDVLRKRHRRDLRALRDISLRMHGFLVQSRRAAIGRGATRRDICSLRLNLSATCSSFISLVPPNSLQIQHLTLQPFVFLSYFKYKRNRPGLRSDIELPVN